MLRSLWTGAWPAASTLSRHFSHCAGSGGFELLSRYREFLPLVVRNLKHVLTMCLGKGDGHLQRVRPIIVRSLWEKPELVQQQMLPTAEQQQALRYQRLQRRD